MIHERGAKRAYGIIGHDIESDVIFWNTLYRSGSTCCQRRPKSQEVHAIREWSQIRNHLRFVGLQRPRGSLISTISSPPFHPSFLETENNIKNAFHKPYAALHPHHSNFLFLEDRTRVSFIPDAEARGSCSMWRDISKAVT